MEHAYGSVSTNTPLTFKEEGILSPFVALSHAAMAKQLFYELKHMPDSDKNKKLIELLREKKHKIQFEEQDDSSKAT